MQIKEYIDNYFQVIILIITLQGELWKKMNLEQIKVDKVIKTK